MVQPRYGFEVKYQNAIEGAVQSLQTQNTLLQGRIRALQKMLDIQGQHSATDTRLSAWRQHVFRLLVARDTDRLRHQSELSKREDTICRLQADLAKSRHSAAQERRKQFEQQRELSLEHAALRVRHSFSRGRCRLIWFDLRSLPLLPNEKMSRTSIFNPL